MKKIRLISIILSLLLITFLLTSCGEKPDEGQFTERAKDLIERSIYLNDIYYGEGLPQIEGALITGDYRAVDTEGLKFKNIAEIKAETEAVYTPEFCLSIYETAFVGISDVNGDGIFPRYTEDDFGVILVYDEIKNILPGERSFDYSTIEILSLTAKKAVIDIQGYTDGEKDETLSRFTFFSYEGEFYLDTPTY